MPKQNRQPWTWRRWLPAAWRLPAIVVLVLVVAVGWWWLPQLLYGQPETGSEARLKAITDTRTALLAGLVGLAAILTFRLNSRGQMTDRYTKAIEQLGSDKLDVRLGGIYALEHIADDSPSYHPTIVEVLSAFTRDHSQPIYRWRQHKKQFEKLEELPPKEELQKANDHVSAPEYPLPDDIQAAATVLGRLRPPLSGSRGDLHKAHLARAKLDGANFSGVNLDEADLSNAQLRGADLTNAQLRGACLKDAELSGAHLRGARSSAKTNWPTTDFPWKEAGVILEEDEEGSRQQIAQR